LDGLEYVAASARRVERLLDELMPPEDASPVLIHRAMRYSVFAGGKRFRPAVVFAACEAVGGDAAAAETAACAVELVHTYSLIHDDLPCMDDDDYRRGKPSSHRVFGEAVAVLAGDALLSLAFELLARPPETHLRRDSVPVGRRLEAVRMLAEASGAAGMVGGQVMDLENEGGPAGPREVSLAHRRKTGSLLAACAGIGGLLGGGDDAQVRSLARFGERLGLAFQIADDLLDADRDSGRGDRKATFVSALGVEGARKAARAMARAAASEASRFGPAGEALKALASTAVERRA